VVDNPSKPLTVSESLRLTFFGDISSEAAVEALYTGAAPALIDGIVHGVPSPDRLRAAAGLYIWTGQIPQATGAYFTPNPYCAKAFVGLADEKGKDLRQSIRWRTGIGDKKGTGALVCCPFEIDDLPMEEQAARLDWLERETGLRLALLTLSGDARPESVEAASVTPERVKKGKSIHAFYAIHTLDPRKDADLKLWTQVQHALIGILRSDHHIVNTGRLMRAPGEVGRMPRTPWATGPVRIQTVLRAEPVAHDPNVLLARLRAAADADGIDDVEMAYAAVVHAAQMKRRAATLLNAGDFERAAVLRVQAEEALRTRAVPASLPSFAAKKPAQARGGYERDADVSNIQDDLQCSPFLKVRSDIVVTADDGRAMSLREWRDALNPGEGLRIFCPQPGCLRHSDGRERTETVAILSRGKGRQIGWYCFVEARVHRVSRDAITYEQDLRVQSDRPRYLPPLDDAGPVLLLAADTGTGKTTRLAEMGGKVKRMLVVCDRVSLAREAAARYQAENYQDLEGPLTASRLVCCINSLDRAAPTSPYELVVLEESESLAGSLFGGTIPTVDRKGKPGSGTLHRTLQKIACATLRTGGRLIAADAFGALGDVSASSALLASLLVPLPNPPVVEVRKHGRTRAGTKVFRYATENDAISAARDLASIGERVIVACSQAQTARLVANELLTVVDDKTRVKVYTRDSDAKARAELGDVGFHWSADRCAAVVFSPVVYTGISYDPKDARDYFDAVFIFGRRVPGIGWTKLLQMGDRFRSATTYHVWIPPVELDKPTSVEHIRAEQVARIEACVAAALEAVPFDARSETKVNSDAHFDLFLEVERAVRLRDEAVNEDYFAWWEAHGAEIIYVPNSMDPHEDIAARNKEQTAERRRERGLAIERALPLTPAEWDAARGSHDANMVNRAEHTRLLDKFGEVPASLAAEDEHRALTKKCEEFARTAAQAGADFRAAARRDIAMVRSGYKAQAPADAQRALARVCLLAACFGDDVMPLVFQASTERSVLEAIRWSGPELKHKKASELYEEMLRHFEISDTVAGIAGLPPEFVARDPAKAVGMCLADIGLRSEATQRRTKNGVVRFYYLELLTREESLRLFDRERRRLRDGQVESLLPATPLAEAGVTHPAATGPIERIATCVTARRGLAVMVPDKQGGARGRAA